MADRKLALKEIVDDLLHEGRIDKKQAEQLSFQYTLTFNSYSKNITVNYLT